MGTKRYVPYSISFMMVLVAMSAVLAFHDFLGPITSGVTISPNPIVQGDAATVTATVDDTTTGGLPIASAEYNIDGGAWSLMDATDGLFDSATESVEADLISFDIAGTYAVCVRGTDAEGNVGASSCAMVTVNALAVNGGGDCAKTSMAIFSNVSLNLRGIAA